MNASDDDDVAIACSLTADEAGDRTADFRALFAAAHVALHREPRELRLWFDNSRSMQESLRELLVAERECCPFFTHTLVDESPRARLALRVPSEAAEAWLDWVEDCVKETAASEPHD